MSPEDEQRTATALVAVQVGLLVLHVLLPRRGGPGAHPGLRRTARVTTAGALTMATASALQLRRGLTASPLPNEHAQLRDTGLFGVVRHPIYTAILAAVTARAVASGNPAQLGVVAALAGLFTVKAGVEERALIRLIPGYADYAREVPRFVPTPRRNRR